MALKPLNFTIDSEAEIEINPYMISQIAKRRAESGVTSGFVDANIIDMGSDDQSAKKTRNELKRDSKPKLLSRCWLCKASRLRVVNVGTTGRRILECANRNCLATIEYTDLPAGTIIEQEKATKKNYGWFLRDTSEMVYPPKERLEAFPNPPFEYVPEVLYDSSKRVLIRCPGQRRLVLLQ